MAETSIEWTATRLPDGTIIPGYTFNPWWVCAEVSPACDHCYARVLARRWGWDWGTDAPRRFFGEHHWNDPRRWNEKARKLGVRLKVFCASMADVFEILPAGHPHAERLEAERQRLWRLIEETPHLDWLLLTKRPKNIQRLVPAAWWAQGFPPQVWVGTTAENQEWAEKRIPHLLRVPARVRFLSCEPLLGALDLTRLRVPLGVRSSMTLSALHEKDGLNKGQAQPRVDWVIVGGESGPGARPMHHDWAHDLKEQCVKAGVPFFFKQWGSWINPGCAAFGREQGRLAAIDSQGRFLDPVPEDETADVLTVVEVGKKRAGRDLGGREWNEMPEVAHV